MTDIIIRNVTGYGYLPIVEIDGQEVYRGEFKLTSLTALMAAEKWLEGSCLSSE